jgi:Domain of unknown function (DUF4263)
MIHVRQFLADAKCYEVIVEKIAALASDPSTSALTDLCQFLIVRDQHTFDKHSIPVLACRGCFSRGPDGVRIAASCIEQAEGIMLATAIVSSLWFAANGELHPIPDARGGTILPPVLTSKPTPETRNAADVVFRDFVSRSQSDEHLFDVLVQFMNTANMMAFPGPLSADQLRKSVFRIISDASLKITKRLLDEYENLLSTGLNEEAYQKFLKANPVLLDPLASHVIAKQALGVEFKTDYVVRRLDNQYFAVEIEKPQDRLFTNADDFSAPFSHAFGQVIDFLEWVDRHAEYARHQMPGISSPRGMLVMGMRAALSDSQAAKLKRLSINTPHIDILTFDDLLTRGRTFYNNIHHSAVSA